MRCLKNTHTTEIYTLSLHDALPISSTTASTHCTASRSHGVSTVAAYSRSEEHTSELQSLTNLVCRLLLEQKKAPGLHLTRREINEHRHRAHLRGGLQGVDGCANRRS